MHIWTLLCSIIWTWLLTELKNTWIDIILILHRVLTINTAHCHRVRHLFATERTHCVFWWWVITPSIGSIRKPEPTQLASLHRNKWLYSNTHYLWPNVCMLSHCTEKLLCYLEDSGHLPACLHLMLPHTELHAVWPWRPTVLEMTNAIQVVLVG